MTGYITVPTKFDPNQAISEALRCISPPTRYGNIAADVNIGEVARCITVAVSGTVTVTDIQGNNSTIPYVQAGQWFPIVFTKIVASGTTAGGPYMWGS